MTNISGLSSGLIQSYEMFKSYKEELTVENMFQMLSVELGGDGETITKDQLDSYIESAEDGDVDISDQELKSLKTIQDNWGNIASSEDADSIAYSDMQEYSMLLLSALTGGISPSNSSENTAISEIDDSDSYDIDSYIISETLGSLSNNKDSSGASSLLHTLLTGDTDEKDDANAGLIATLTNIIADYEAASSVDVDA